MSYKKVIITRFGPPDVLKVVEQEFLPVSKKGEVRVRVIVTSASFTDTLIRKGMYPEVRKRPPITPGYDLVGRVDACGEGVTAFQIGQRVAAMPVYGAYSEYICLPQESLTPVPDGLDSAEVVSLVLTYMTAYQMLHRVAAVRQGTSILVHGAGGAVGTALLQLGALQSLKMFGTARTAKLDLVKSLGATGIDYESEDFVRFVHEATGGVDAVFDGIGGEYFKRSFLSLKSGGFLVAYGFQHAVLNNGSLLSIARGFIQLKLWNVLPNKRRVVFYSITAMRKKHPEWFREDLAKLMELLQQRKIQPVIFKKMPLTEAVEAHKLLDASQVPGKIILIVGRE
jgi:NADPH:quinone reductase-like Zn-dependent oxidoreductase